MISSTKIVFQTWYFYPFENEIAFVVAFSVQSIEQTLF